MIIDGEYEVGWGSPALAVLHQAAGVSAPVIGIRTMLRLETAQVVARVLGVALSRSSYRPASVSGRTSVELAADVTSAGASYYHENSVKLSTIMALIGGLRVNDGETAFGIVTRDRLACWCR